MQPVKRIEIHTGVQELPRVEEALKRCGVSGFLVLNGVRGRGNERIESLDALTGEPQDRLVQATCPPERLDEVLETLRPVLNRYGGSCVVYDAVYAIHSHRDDPSRGMVVKAKS
ncbi:MAG: hypothetical protein U0835_20800 [Isosphaeraceae bacterium]